MTGVQTCALPIWNLDFNQHGRPDNDHCNAHVQHRDWDDYLVLRRNASALYAGHLPITATDKIKPLFGGAFFLRSLGQFVEFMAYVGTISCFTAKACRWYLTLAKLPSRGFVVDL